MPTTGHDLIGIISDTHNNLGRVDLAIGELRQRGVELLIHCGDICAPTVVDALGEFEVHWVTGNCDYAGRELTQAIDDMGHTFHGDQGEINVNGLRLGFTHGHQPWLISSMVSDGTFDFVFHGHTHERKETAINGTRLICPGALHRASPPGFALLKADGTIEFVDL